MFEFDPTPRHIKVIFVDVWVWGQFDRSQKNNLEDRFTKIKIFVNPGLIKSRR